MAAVSGRCIKCGKQVSSWQNGVTQIRHTDGIALLCCNAEIDMTCEKGLYTLKVDGKVIIKKGVLLD